MAFDSQIRLRQLNQSDLSGWLSNSMFPILSGSGLNVYNNNISPTYSGTENLGSSNFPYNTGFFNNIYIPSGNSINFGNTTLTAWTSGNYGLVTVGGYNIISNNNALMIIGPSGPSGAIGPIGNTGISGIGVTGISGSGTLTLLFSNGGTSNTIILPSGKQGPSGISNTGYYQSGNFLSPLFSNGSTGSSFFIPSGQMGVTGPVGAININFGQMTGFITGATSPTPYVILNINPTITQNPPINAVKGMNYTFGYSGLNIFQVSGFPTNLFIDDFGRTGYLQFTLFDPTSPVGRFVSGEATQSYSFYSSLIDNSDVMLGPIIAPNLNQISFGINFTANSNYYYGFQRYLLATQTPIDDNVNQGEWGFYILGQFNTNYFGPVGLSGVQGIAGIPGPAGDLGPPGSDGPPGISISGVNTFNNNIQFVFTDGSVSQWINLPSGGPQGGLGPTGPQGISGAPGGIGATGATGPAGHSDTYFAEFYPSNMVISGFTGLYKQVSGTSPFIECTGTNVFMAPGDNIYFQTPSLVGKAYSPWQSVLFADDNFYNARYFYASVVSFNNNNGAMQCVVNSNPPPVGTSGGYIQLWNYSLIDMNLGGLGSPGVQGPTGAQGTPGTGAYSTFQNSNFIYLPGNSGITLNPALHNCWNLVFTGLNNTINLNYSTFYTGATVLIKLSNSGNYFNNASLNPSDDPEMIWDPAMYFPYGTPFGADPGTSTLFTLLRVPDMTTGLSPTILVTYASNYNV